MISFLFLLAILGLLAAIGLNALRSSKVGRLPGAWAVGPDLACAVKAHTKCDDRIGARAPRNEAPTYSRCTYKGEIYFFRSEEDREIFLANLDGCGESDRRPPAHCARLLERRA